MTKTWRRATSRSSRNQVHNLNLCWNKSFGLHSVYAETGYIFRDTRDYIKRNLQAISGGLFNATYVNYGKVMTNGFSLSASYNFSTWFSLGGNFTRMNMVYNMKTGMNDASWRLLRYNCTDFLALIATVE